jgi:hypothetical protein
MYISTCLAFEDLELILSNINECIGVNLKNKNKLQISLTLKPMQCKILGEALLNFVGQMKVNKEVSNFTGTMDVLFELEAKRKEGETLCQLQNLVEKKQALISA